MKVKFYHKSLEYSENYNFDKLGTSGISLNCQRVVCPTCNGNGSHFRNDLDENNMINSINDDCDEDSFNAYLNGAFDQTCTECNGQNVVDYPNWSIAPDWIQKCVNDWEEEERHDAIVRRAERGF